MMTINHAILHSFDFESGGTYFSDQELDRDNKQVKSYVQRTCRKCLGSAENRHGEFAEGSGFAEEIRAYRKGELGFVELSVQIAQWFWEELRRGEDLANADLLVVDFEESAEAPKAGDDEEAADAAFDARPERTFAIVLLPRRQSFVHELAGFEGHSINGIVRTDATLPSPTQKIDTYALVIDQLRIVRALTGQTVRLRMRPFRRCHILQAVLMSSGAAIVFGESVAFIDVYQIGILLQIIGNVAVFFALPHGHDDLRVSLGPVRSIDRSILACGFRSLHFLVLDILPGQRSQRTTVFQVIHQIILTCQPAEDDHQKNQHYQREYSLPRCVFLHLSLHSAAASGSTCQSLPALFIAAVSFPYFPVTFLAALPSSSPAFCAAVFLSASIFIRSVMVITFAGHFAEHAPHWVHLS